MNALLRRRIMALAAEEGNKEMIEPFYSDFPELTESGIYVLTPQTEETESCNTFLQIGETKYQWAGSAAKSDSCTVIICDAVSRAYLKSILDPSETLQRIQSAVNKKEPIKLKRCSGSEDSEALITFCVEQIF